MKNFQTGELTAYSNSVDRLQHLLGLEGGNEDRIIDIKNGLGCEETLVTFYPDYTVTNPYQTLLYSGAWDGVSIAPGDIDSAIRLVAENGNKTNIFHLHWISFVLANSMDIEEATRAVDEYLGKLREFIARGGILIWTIHNSVEHDASYIDQENRLRREIVALATRVHLHSAGQVNEIGETLEIPKEKITIIPHGNYVGVYPRFLTRVQSREIIGIKQDEICFLFLGQIRPYKGLEDVLDAFGKIRALNPRARLVIAGKVLHPYSPEIVNRAVRNYPGVSVHLGEVSDAELQIYYQAADFCVLAYKRILNSGSIFCALSFDCPTIAPRVSATSELASTGGVFLFGDNAEYGSLYSAMERAIGLSTAELEVLRSKIADGIKAYTWDGAAEKLFGFSVCDESRFAARVNYLRDFSLDSVSLTAVVSEPKGKTKAKVGISILNYEGGDDVDRLLGSLKGSLFNDYEIVIVDNASQNESIESLARRYAEASIIRLSENYGYAVGNNVAIKFLQERDVEYIWILNPDTFVNKESLLELVQATSEFDPNKTVFGSVISLPPPGNKIWFAGGYVQLNPVTKIGHILQGKSASDLPSLPYKVDYITGASLFAHKSIFDKVGLIPEEYFLYFEETDWCTRARKLEIDMLVVPGSKIVHYKRSQVGVLPTRYYFYYFIRGALMFRRKYVARSIESIEMEVRKSFVEPWLKKIKASAPDAYRDFEGLANIAIQDGRNGVGGRRDLNSLFQPISLAGKPLASCVAVEDYIKDGQINIWMVSETASIDPAGVSFKIDANGKSLPSYIRTRSQESLGAIGSKTEALNALVYYFNADEYEEDSIDVQLIYFGELISTKKYSGVKAAALPPKPKGRIDGFVDRSLKGWVIDEARPGRLLDVEVLCDGVLIGICHNVEWRPDLIKAGLPTGKGGFSIPVPITYCSGAEHSFELRIQGSGKGFTKRALKMDVRRYGEVPADATVADLDSWLFSRREIWQNHSKNREIAEKIEANRSSVVRPRPAAQNSKAGLVSIVMPAFNRANVLTVAFQALAKQTYRNWELLFVDDGSADDTVEVAKQTASKFQFGDRFRLIKLPRNLGVSGARNVGLAAAAGQIIAYLDSDNAWDDEYLEVMVAHALRYKGKDFMLYCADRIVQNYTDGRAPEVVCYRWGRPNLTLLSNKNYIDLNVLVHSKALFDRLGGFDEQMRRLVDWDLIYNYSKWVVPEFVPEVLVTYNLDLSDNQITRLENYGLNADLILSKIDERIDGSVGVFAPIPKGTQFGQICLVPSELGGQPNAMNPNWEMYRRAIAQSSGIEAERIVIQSIDLQSLSSELTQTEHADYSSDYWRQLATIFSMYSASDEKGVVLISTGLVNYGPQEVQQVLEKFSNNPSLSAIYPAKWVPGRALRAYQEVNFKNSVEAFPYDLTPIQLEANGYRLCPLDGEADVQLKGGALNFGAIFIRGSQLKKLRDFIQRKSSSAKTKGQLFPEGSVMYCPSIGVRQIF